MEKNNKKNMTLPEMGLFAKGIVTAVGVTRKGRPEYAIAIGNKMLTIFDDVVLVAGEVVEFQVKLFDDALRAGIVHNNDLRDGIVAK